MAAGKNTQEDAGSIRHQEYQAAWRPLPSEARALLAEVRTEVVARDEYQRQQEDTVRAAGFGTAGILGELEL